LEVDIFAELGGFGGAVFAVHAAVFPFDGEGSGVFGGVEGADDFFEANAAASDAAEVPAASGVTEGEVAAEDTGAAVEGNGGIFHVDVVDAIGEGADEFDGINALPDEVAGVEVEAEFLASVECLECAFGGVEVEGDFGGVYFEGEFDAAVFEDIEDGVPAFGEELEAAFDHGFGGWGEVVDEMPDGGAGEAIDDADIEFLGGAGGFFHFFGGAVVDAGGVTITPDVIGEDAFVSGIDVIEDGLSDEVVGDGEEFEAVFFEEFAFAGAVGIVGEGFVDFEVVAPAGKFESIVAEFFGFFAECFEWEVGPLAGEEGNGTCHFGGAPAKLAAACE
jgi:hypothetical protein